MLSGCVKEQSETDFSAMPKGCFYVSTHDFTWFLTTTGLIRKTSLGEIDGFVGLLKMNAFTRLLDINFLC